MGRPLQPAVLLVLLLAGCGTQAAAPGTSISSPGSASATPATAASSGSVSAGSGPGTVTAGEVFGLFTVLEKGSDGPMACSTVLTSLPPQCEGPGITGWEWASAPGTLEKVNGVRWSEAALVGTWNGKTLTLTRQPMTPEAFRAEHALPDEPADFTTPCPEPAGGWVVTDSETANLATMEQAISAAQNLATYGGHWLDQSVNPAASKPNAEGDAMNNPKKLILNIRVTEDAAGAERLLRRTWGGMLCVSQGGRSEADLLTLRDEIHAAHSELTGSGIDSQRGRIEISTFADDGSLQREMDDKYGTGIVEVQTHLMPYPPG